MEVEGREVMLHRCDTEAITLGEITGGGIGWWRGDRERKDDTCPIDKTISKEEPCENKRRNFTKSPV